MRRFSNLALPQPLQVGIDDTSTELEVITTEGYPEPPFIISVGRGEDPLNVVPEVMLVTAKTATTFTVERGYEGTEALPHLAGEKVEHTSSAEVYQRGVTVVPEWQLGSVPKLEGKVVVVTREGEPAPEPAPEPDPAEGDPVIYDTNLMVGDFETPDQVTDGVPSRTDTKRWWASSDTAVRSTDQAHGGDYSLTMAGVGEGGNINFYGQMSQEAWDGFQFGGGRYFAGRIDPGDIMVFEGFWLTHTEFGASVVLRITDAEGDPLEESFNSVPDTGGEWEDFSLSLVAPEGAKWMQLSVQSTSSPRIFLDDISLIVTKDDGGGAR